MTICITVQIEDVQLEQPHIPDDVGGVRLGGEGLGGVGLGLAPQ